jgi:hypothetical protein
MNDKIKDEGPTNKLLTAGVWVIAFSLLALVWIVLPSGTKSLLKGTLAHHETGNSQWEGRWRTTFHEREAGNLALVVKEDTVTIDWNLNQADQFEIDCSYSVQSNVLSVEECHYLRTLFSTQPNIENSKVVERLKKKRG